MKGSIHNGKTLQALWAKNKGYFRWIMAMAAASEYEDGPTLQNVKEFLQLDDIKPVFEKYCFKWDSRLKEEPVGAYVMRIMCAWHMKHFGEEKEMGWKKSKQVGTSHGICKECRAKEQEIEDKRLAEKENQSE